MQSARCSGIIVMGWQAKGKGSARKEQHLGSGFMAQTHLPCWSTQLTGTFLHFPHSIFSHWTNVLVSRSDL